MLFNVSIFLVSCVKCSHKFGVPFYVRVYHDSEFFNCLPYYLLCNVLNFLSQALFYFFPILLSVCAHFDVQCFSIYIHVSIFPPVSIFLPVLISIFLPVSISIFLSVSISIFLPVSISIFLPVSIPIFLLVSIFLPRGGISLAWAQARAQLRAQLIS